MKVQLNFVAFVLDFSLIILVFTSSVLCNKTNKNEKSFTTSVAGMEDLLLKEQQLLQILQLYASDLELRLNTIREYV